MVEYSDEDVGNIVLLEHVNVQVPDQAVAMMFYIMGMGFTRDPYLNIGLGNMWANVGEQQFHLPTRPAQVIQGHIGVVVPDLGTLKDRLTSVELGLAGEKICLFAVGKHINLPSSSGKRFFFFPSCPPFCGVGLWLSSLVVFLVAPGRAAGIARFYDQVLGAPAATESSEQGTLGRVKIGRNQSLVFRETEEPLTPYDGHHIAIYVANFSRAYGYLKSRGLISEDVRNHQYRFKEIIDPDNGGCVFLIEHELRSIHHPMFHRFLVTRDPAQTQRGYRRERDALIPYH